ncbi:MAG TPA: D-alanyl-D-alanine carboxypeptidase [Motilibacterales bacterium]|nr:D-alanyl-D-alanine carboxypeptidase [Motilibacterales bacterium]
MHRSPTATIALGCALTLLAGAAPAAVAAPAAGTATAPARNGVNVAEDARVSSSATRSRVATSAANTRINQVLRKRTTSKILGKRFTMTVWDSASGAYVYQRRASASLRGASTTKILTAVGVLAALGPDHRLPTTVRAGATPDEVVLVAGGDPLLTSAELRTLAAATASNLGLPASPPASSAAPAADAASPAAVDPAASPSPAAVDPAVSPAVDPAASPSAPAPTVFPTRTITVRADDSLFSGFGQSRGWPNSYLPRQVRPVGAFARDDNKVRDATSDAGRYFVSALRTLGVVATYAGESSASPEAATLASIPGHSVAQAVSRMLLISDNDTAEMLFRHIAVARGLPGTWAGARQALTDTLRELDVPLGGVRIIDGSGLSLEGRLTAGALTSALARALSPEHPRLAGVRGWLPVAGRTGTLKAGYRRFSAKPARCAAGRIQAKTGTVADAIALAGYAAGADGQTKVFVSIVNSRPTRYSRVTTRTAVDRATSSITGCW